MPRVLDQTWQLLDDFADAVQMLDEHGEQETQVMDLVCDLTRKVVGADHAAVTTRRGTRCTVVAATSDVPEALHAIQLEEHEGPTLDAIHDHDTLRSGDLSRDRRWRRFGPRAADEVGTHSALAHVLPLGTKETGALTVYAARRDAFTGDHASQLAIFGANVASTLRALSTQNELVNFRAALRTSRRIGVSLGILMTTRQVLLDEAWELLAKESQNRNIKVSVLAENVIATGGFDPPPDN
ncbi:GAF and ANTAR domain-containing protein [Knoellia koreensis]|uniref:GAF and ANTAR domain-containing protein n=1 Tax=Knoellia koreensis TaxID=2730921 RepID=A0A849HBU0_9MICO|nr:GAF and ANTAR domain-containing protein [Knoellia sp. DB2414S]NNM45405.1 GAF and ANTAR domain-containing protein [Knoellia sp. DB2414S]